MKRHPRDACCALPMVTKMRSSLSVVDCGFSSAVDSDADHGAAPIVVRSPAQGIVPVVDAPIAHARLGWEAITEISVRGAFLEAAKQVRTHQDRLPQAIAHALTPNEPFRSDLVPFEAFVADILPEVEDDVIKVIAEKARAATQSLKVQQTPEGSSEYESMRLSTLLADPKWTDAAEIKLVGDDVELESALFNIPLATRATETIARLRDRHRSLEDYRSQSPAVQRVLSLAESAGLSEAEGVGLMGDLYARYTLARLVTRHYGDTLTPQAFSAAMSVHATIPADKLHAKMVKMKENVPAISRDSVRALIRLGTLAINEEQVMLLIRVAGTFVLVYLASSIILSTVVALIPTSSATLATGGFAARSAGRNVFVRLLSLTLAAAGGYVAYTARDFLRPQEAPYAPQLGYSTRR